ncbi:DNA-processing protein DprA [Chlorobium phaeobacteroides]|uniref:Smf/DprA SLOG domain-containing protein n=1 Tax=Chlorobium phaeobacteroides (strain DSM 266 / SMG 266 / 2430) TaxID=290317 RepID=A1BFJ0_CHLPD|nr:DNA-processing protein DprA [Chlorobium phaeobacteroides]ABL65167.1 conserved hypothetical protein [Chlorobium phaeobacteroides DSM 266]
MQKLSSNTKAILLLTAPLIASHGSLLPDLLSPSEYNRLARHLHDMQREPADLLLPDAGDLHRACKHLVDEKRLQSLLERGFLLSQVIEHWQARAIWVVSRADAAYPRRLKARLREGAPAVLYGCGDINLLEAGGLAVVGSRHVDDEQINYTMAIGQLAALADRMIISGGAKGIDQAAMQGALEADGKVCGILADRLERTAMNREHRNLIIEERLVLVSPYDPSAGFNVGHAMQRNKLIYALADASLVINSDINKGGTWAGATEQLDKLRLVPVYVRSTGTASRGIDALRNRGALPWPEPHDVKAFEALLDTSPSLIPVGRDVSIGLFPNGMVQDSVTDTVQEKPQVQVMQEISLPVLVSGKAELSPAQRLFATVREVIRQLLKKPMTDTEIAERLELSTLQTRVWLQLLVDEGILEKKNKPVRYFIKEPGFFENGHHAT